ncbi:hypothetical protein WNY78_18550 [Psychroserpens sp. AS72]|uniref:alpha/beta hydrolase family protein n=1 Tax=Psychroserpens sp. AS72 TaxID=3135775 RepID=UPI0031798842
MKSIIIIYLTFLQCITIYAQENFYDFVKLGDYQVGITDTLVLDAKYDYNAYDYKGQKPYFVKIWHPIKKKDKNIYLNVSDLFVFKQNTNLKTVQEQLTTKYKNLFIEDYLTENLKTGKVNLYGKYSYEDVFDLIGRLETRSIPDSNIGDSNFPIIIYHNGSQGHPFENFAMAEYFASRGFIFVTASFELQFDNTPFGMLPYERYITDEEEESLQSITKFAKSLTNSSSIFFIGHSMGAQMGLRTFGEDNSIKGMISLETSIEFKTDYEKIKEMWPEVYQKVITEKVNYPFPILFCAATGEKKPFNFLENVKAPQISFVSTKTEFEHNAHLSFFYLRYFLDNEVQQADKAILKNRLTLYVKHLDIMYDFIERILNNENKDVIESIFIEE